MLFTIYFPLVDLDVIASPWMAKGQVAFFAPRYYFASALLRMLQKYHVECGATTKQRSVVTRMD